MTSSSNTMIYQSFYSEKNMKPSSSGIFSLEKNECFFHSNEKVLNSFCTDDIQNATARVENGNFYQNKNVLFIGHGSASRMPILKQIAQYRFKRLVGLCKAQTWAKSYFSEWIFADPEKLDRIHETIDSVQDYIDANDMEFDAIVTYDDYCIEVATFLANYFNLPSTPFNTLLAIRNKDAFRRLCYDLGINHPRFLSIKSSSRFNFVDRIKSNKFLNLRSVNNELIRFPMIIKNTVGAGKGNFF
jgi:hypothetical protein